MISGRKKDQKAFSIQGETEPGKHSNWDLIQKLSAQILMKSMQSNTSLILFAIGNRNVHV